MRLDRLTRRELEREGGAAGCAAGRATVPPNEDYVGSSVVMLRA